MLIEPVYSRITGVWTTVIARKVTGPNGEFLGAIGRGIEPANFEKFFATVALGKGAAVETEPSGLVGDREGGAVFESHLVWHPGD